MHLMRELDPDGVRQRKTRRLKRRSYTCKVWLELFTCSCIKLPSSRDLIKFGGYDKLTPYGLSIHGCIDG